MPTGQHYATNTPQTTLQGGGVGAGDTSCTVQSSVSWPPTPFTAIFDLGQSNQEPVDVTNISGTSWTVTRAIDGTSPFVHSNGATVTFGVIGRDFKEARAHIDASGPLDSTNAAVHGLANVAGNVVVGATGTQTLTNKTLTSAVANNTSTSARSLLVNSISGTTNDAMAVQYNGTTFWAFNSSGNLSGQSGSQLDMTGMNSVPFIGQGAVSYTPTWTCATGSAPSVGNGALTGYYFKWGRMVTVFINLVAGSTTTFGSGGNWLFALPFPVAHGSGFEYVNTGFGFCAGNLFVGITDVAGGGSNLQVFASTGGGAVQNLTSSFPGNWTNGNSTRLALCYEATS